VRTVLQVFAYPAAIIALSGYGTADVDKLLEHAIGGPAPPPAEPRPSG
jgi:hypothetical protein